jgi:DNA-binding response OmpR family regulator
MEASSLPHPDALRRGPLVLAATDSSLSVHGHRFNLNGTELRTLRYLMIESGRVVRWSELCTHLWDHEAAGARAATEVAISRLQNKMGRELLRRVPELGVVLEC